MEEKIKLNNELFNTVKCGICKRKDFKFEFIYNGKYNRKCELCYNREIHYNEFISALTVIINERIKKDYNVHNIIYNQRDIKKIIKIKCPFCVQPYFKKGDYTNLINILKLRLYKELDIIKFCCKNCIINAIENK